jgi:hypothetical protein
MSERRQCLSLYLLGLQVIWLIVAMALVEFKPGEPKRLIYDSLMLVVGYLPTIVAMPSALIEMRSPPRKGLNLLSLLALGLSVLILSANLVIWYRNIWLDPHGIWPQRHG